MEACAGTWGDKQIHLVHSMNKHCHGSLGDAHCRPRLPLVLTVMALASGRYGSDAAVALTPTPGLSSAVQGATTQTAVLVSSGDYYWANGRKMPLSRVAGEVLVRIKATTDPQAFVRNTTGATGVLAGFKLYVRLDARTLGFKGPQDTVAKDDARVDDLRKLPSVLWAAPVFISIESGTRLWVTDEIVVALNSGMDPSQVFTPDFGARRRIPGTPDQYLVTLANGGGRETLDAANRLSSSPGVAWASPNFHQELTTETGE